MNKDQAWDWAKELRVLISRAVTRMRTRLVQRIDETASELAAGAKAVSGEVTKPPGPAS